MKFDILQHGSIRSQTRRISGGFRLPLCSRLSLIAAIASLQPTIGHAGEVGARGGVSTSDWSSIRTVYETNRFRAVAIDSDYLARNPSQQWQIRFDCRGFMITPDVGGWSWGLDLVSVGRQIAEHAAETPSCVETDGSHIAYQRSDQLTEWYDNNSRGLEHGYTVREPPEGMHTSIATKPLHFTLGVRGDLRPNVSGDGRNVTFINSGGAAVVNYTDLKVLDAEGCEVPAWFAGATLPTASSLQPFPSSSTTGLRAIR